MGMIRIVDAKPLDANRVQLTLSNGRVVERELETLLRGPVFDEIRGDPVKFKELRVEGGTLVWPNGGLCPDVLIWEGLPPADAAFDAV